MKSCAGEGRTADERVFVIGDNGARCEQQWNQQGA